MEPELIRQLGAVAGVIGVVLGLFFLVARNIVNKNIFPQLNRTQAFRTLRYVLFLSFFLAILGMTAWLAGERLKRAARTTLEDRLLKTAFRFTMEGDRLIAEKETGKIVVTDRGSCVDDHPWAAGPVTVLEGARMVRDESGAIRVESDSQRQEKALRHQIYFEVLNLFPRPVAVMEHHVISLIDSTVIKGYRYKPDMLSALKEGESRKFVITTPSPIDSRIKEHLDKFDSHQHGATEAIVVLTSEGPLPPVPVRSISHGVIPCEAP